MIMLSTGGREIQFFHFQRGKDEAVQFVRISRDPKVTSKILNHLVVAILLNNNSVEKSKSIFNLTVRCDSKFKIR